MMINPNDPDAPRQLMVRSLEIIKGLATLGIDPLHDETDLLLVSLLPLAIKQARFGFLGEEFTLDDDYQVLRSVLDRLDLRELAEYIRTRTH